MNIIPLSNNEIDLLKNSIKLSFRVLTTAKIEGIKPSKDGIKALAKVYERLHRIENIRKAKAIFDNYNKLISILNDY